MVEQDIENGMYWMIEDLDMDSSTRGLWDYASKKLGVKYAKKGTEEYEIVKSFYLRLLKVPLFESREAEVRSEPKKSCKKPKLFQCFKKCPEAAVMDRFMEVQSIIIYLY